MRKRFISILTAFFGILGAAAQVPGSFQYQAVMRNDDGSIASNKPLEVEGAHSPGLRPTARWCTKRTHTTSTNASGIIILQGRRGRQHVRASPRPSTTSTGVPTQLLLRDPGRPGYRLCEPGNPAAAQRALCQVCRSGRQRAHQIARRENVAHQGGQRRNHHDRSRKPNKAGGKDSMRRKPYYY